MGTIYFFKVGDKELFKIGKTSGDVDKRLKAVSTGSAYTLEVYKTFEHESYSKLERYIHDFFDDSRADNGEFFYIPLDELDLKLDEAVKSFEKLERDKSLIEELKNITNKDVMLDTDLETVEIYKELRALREVQKELKEKQEVLENKLKLIIGENEGIVDIATWKTQEKNRFNTKKFEEEHPEEYKKYIEVTKYRVLRLQ